MNVFLDLVIFQKEVFSYSDTFLNNAGLVSAQPEERVTLGILIKATSKYAEQP